MKNELARARADFERDRKKQALDSQCQLELALREAEDRADIEMKQAREKLERAHKKRLEDRDREWQSKLEAADRELEVVREAHAEELRREKTRAEARVRDQVRADVKQELHVVLDEEYRHQFEMLESKHQQELERLRLK